MRAYSRILSIFLILYLVFVQPVVAAGPFLYLRGSHIAVTDFDQTWDIMLNSNGETVSVIQTVLEFNSQHFSPAYVNTINSLCSFWIPADPSLGFGNNTTPYFNGGNKIVLSCGLTNPGYTTTNSFGHSLALITLRVYRPGTTAFNFTNTQFRYNGSVINASASSPFDVTVYGASVEAQRPYTLSPVSSPSAVDPTNPPETLRASDLNLVDINSSTRSARQYASSSGLSDASLNSANIVNLDNSIPPPPPDMSPRPNATPYPSGSDTALSTLQEAGEVLSLQSLRELLIPGKSTADKTLVLFNLISTLTFVVLLAILIWRMIVSSRSNRLKYRHMNDLLEGELAVLESKLEGSGQPSEAGQSLDDLKKELENQPKI